MSNPQATIGFNTKSWSNDLDDLRAPHGCETSKNGEHWKNTPFL